MALAALFAARDGGGSKQARSRPSYPHKKEALKGQTSFVWQRLRVGFLPQEHSGVKTRRLLWGALGSAGVQAPCWEWRAPPGTSPTSYRGSPTCLLVVGAVRVCSSRVTQTHLRQLHRAPVAEHGVEGVPQHTHGRTHHDGVHAHAALGAHRHAAQHEPSSRRPHALYPHPHARRRAEDRAGPAHIPHVKRVVSLLPAWFASVCRAKPVRCYTGRPSTATLRARQWTTHWAPGAAVQCTAEEVQAHGFSYLRYLDRSMARISHAKAMANNAPTNPIMRPSTCVGGTI